MAKAAKRRARSAAASSSSKPLPLFDSDGPMPRRVGCAVFTNNAVRSAAKRMSMKGLAKKRSAAAPSNSKQLFIPAVGGAAPALPLFDSQGPMPRRMLLACAVRYILAAVGDDLDTPDTLLALEALRRELAEYKRQTRRDLFRPIRYDSIIGGFQPRGKGRA